MQIQPYAEIGSEKWNAFCIESKNSWLRHTSTFIDFALTLGESSENLSFAAADTSGRLIALQPLVAQGKPGAREFVMGGTPLPFPSFAGDTEHEERMEALSTIMAEIDRLAAARGVARARMFVDPLTEPILSGQMKESPFVRFGFQDTSHQTTCIDLSQSEESIFAGIGKGHRSDIHFAQREEYGVDFFDGTDLSDKLCEVYERLYVAAARKQVGTTERWEKTFSMIRDGYAVLVLGRLKDSQAYIAGNVVLHYKSRAYYALSAAQPGAAARGMGALLQWETITYLKQRNTTRYELGWIAKEGSSEKEIAISRFKTHFGGDILPVFRAEKLY